MGYITHMIFGYVWKWGIPQDCQFDSENDEPAAGTEVTDFQTVW